MSRTFEIAIRFFVAGLVLVMAMLVVETISGSATKTTLEQYLEHKFQNSGEQKW